MQNTRATRQDAHGARPARARHTLGPVPAPAGILPSASLHSRMKEGQRFPPGKISARTNPEIRRHASPELRAFGASRAPHRDAGGRAGEALTQSRLSPPKASPGERRSSPAPSPQLRRRASLNSSSRRWNVASRFPHTEQFPRRPAPRAATGAHARRSGPRGQSVCRPGSRAARQTRGWGGRGGRVGLAIQLPASWSEVAPAVL